MSNAHLFRACAHQETLMMHRAMPRLARIEALRPTEQYEPQVPAPLTASVAEVTRTHETAVR